MERFTLIALLCVVFHQKKISGVEMEMRVRSGDHVTLYCDCVTPPGTYMAWIRNCSHENQPPFVIYTTDVIRLKFARFRFLENMTSKSFDLRIENVTEKDLGIYYCARTDKQISTGDGMIAFQYGNWTTRLSLMEDTSTSTTVSPITNVPEGCVSWQAFLLVVTGCVLFSSVLSSICVYCIYGKRNRETNQKGRTYRQTPVPHQIGDDVCYASLDVQNLSKKKEKKKAQQSDFSTYSEVRA